LFVQYIRSILFFVQLSEGARVVQGERDEQYRGTKKEGGRKDQQAQINKKKQGREKKERAK